jgi:hypothetical protein
VQLYREDELATVPGPKELATIGFACGLRDNRSLLADGLDRWPDGGVSVGGDIHIGNCLSEPSG